MQRRSSERGLLCGEKLKNTAFAHFEHRRQFVGAESALLASSLQFDELAMQGETPILLTSPGIRPYVRSIVERFRAHTVVLSQNEIHPRARIKTVGMLQ